MLGFPSNFEEEAKLQPLGLYKAVQHLNTIIGGI